MGQMAKEISQIKAQGSGKLSFQTILNPKKNASVITLKSGKQLEEVSSKPNKPSQLETKPPKSKSPPKVTFKDPIASTIPPPFPSRLAKSNTEEHEKEVLETFMKVQVNIPLVDAIMQVPRYAKFLKELCTTKRKLKGNEVMFVGENCSAIL